MSSKKVLRPTSRKPKQAARKKSGCLPIFMVLVILLGFAGGIGFGVLTGGASMEPELLSGQEVLVNRFAYMLANPQAGDVVVFLPNGNENTHYYVKRVAACPGDTVQIRDGVLYVNGEGREDDYDLITDAGIAENEIRLGENEFFVMGDNCNSSEDSRSGNIGPVRRDHIVGEAWFKLGNGSAGFVH